jgi:urea transporter
MARRPQASATDGHGASARRRLLRGTLALLAPGVPLTHPEPHWTVVKALAAGTEIIGETTANGLGNYFHQLWQDAEAGKTNFQAIFALYALKKFAFAPQQIGAILVVTALVSAVIQGALTGPLTRRWHESSLIKVFLLTNALGFLVLLAAYEAHAADPLVAKIRDLVTELKATHKAISDTHGAEAYNQLCRLGMLGNVVFTC